MPQVGSTLKRGLLQTEQEAEHRAELAAQRSGTSMQASAAAGAQDRPAAVCLMSSCWTLAHCTVRGWTWIKDRCKCHPFSMSLLHPLRLLPQGTQPVNAVSALDRQFTCVSSLWCQPEVELARLKMSLQHAWVHVSNRLWRVTSPLVS